MPASYGSREMSVYILPGDTFLFRTLVEFMPAEGMFIDYMDSETQVVTKYRVQDVIIEALEMPIVAIPGGIDSELKHHTRLRVEVAVVP